MLEPEDVEPAGRVRGRAPARRRQARGRRRPPGAGPRSGTLVARPARARGRRRGGARAAGDRAPARPRHVGPARRRALRGGAPAAEEAWSRRRELERDYLALVRGRPRSRARADRGADRARPQRPDAALARHRQPARGGHALRARRAPRASTRSCACGSRPGRTHQIRVHLAAIGLPVAGDAVYGVVATSGSSGSSCTRPASPSRIPFTRRAGRGGVRRSRPTRPGILSGLSR